MKKVLVGIIALTLAIGIIALPGTIRPAVAQTPRPLEISLDISNNNNVVNLDENHLLTLRLEANPSTGYGWQVSKIDGNVLRQVGDEEFQLTTGRIGGPGVQVLRFAGIAKGPTSLQLVYSRPWEKAEPLQTFSVQVNADVYTGVMPVSSAKAEPLAKPTPTPTPAPGLPAAFSWCNQNGCTPIKDQGNCGSCWAFSTVGVLESAIKIATGNIKDLSEQYLVSCNSDGWSCNGGWYAHNYHQWKYITGEPGPGAVYESDFRYQAANVPCNPPHTHYEKISSWAYVGNSSSVPSVNAIKQAIYTYGPVSAAVYVGSDFQRYTGGVFTSRQKGTVNHAIVLVGWDDSQGYWILRNSWGTSWGESGYMRIAYGTSNVGYAASYIVFP